MKDDVLKPLLRRIGTAAGAFLVAQGYLSGDQAALALDALTAIGLLALDLFSSHQERKARG